MPTYGAEATAPEACTVRPPSTASAARRSAEKNWLEREASTVIVPEVSDPPSIESGRHPS